MGTYDLLTQHLKESALRNSSRILVVASSEHIAALSLASSNDQIPGLRRDILFAFWDGEEYGMFGSTHFVEDRLPALEPLGSERTVFAAEKISSGGGTVRWS